MRASSIAIIDDQPIMLHGLVQIFVGNSNFNIVDTGESAAAALEIVATHRVDLLILDPTTQGCLEAISEIKSKSPDTRVVAFSSAIGADYAVRSLEAGACGYVVKKSTPKEIEEAMLAVLRGETFISSSFASVVITALRDQRVRKRAAQVVDFNTREQQIVRLLLRGKTNKEIASKLSISEKTVKHYMTNMMQKLNVRNRTEAVIAAQRIWDAQSHDTPPFFPDEPAAKRGRSMLEAI